MSETGLFFHCFFFIVFFFVFFYCFFLLFFWFFNFLSQKNQKKKTGLANFKNYCCSLDKTKRKFYVRDILLMDVRVKMLPVASIIQVFFSFCFFCFFLFFFLFVLFCFFCVFFFFFFIYILFYFVLLAMNFYFSIHFFLYLSLSKKGDYYFSEALKVSEGVEGPLDNHFAIRNYIESLVPFFFSSFLLLSSLCSLSFPSLPFSSSYLLSFLSLPLFLSPTSLFSLFLLLKGILSRSRETISTRRSKILSNSRFFSDY